MSKPAFGTPINYSDPAGLAASLAAAFGVLEGNLTGNGSTTTLIDSVTGTNKVTLGVGANVASQQIVTSGVSCPFATPLAIPCGSDAQPDFSFAWRAKLTTSPATSTAGMVAGLGTWGQPLWMGSADGQIAFHNGAGPWNVAGSPSAGDAIMTGEADYVAAFRYVAAYSWYDVTLFCNGVSLGSQTIGGWSGDQTLTTLCNGYAGTVFALIGSLDYFYFWSGRALGYTFTCTAPTVAPSVGDSYSNNGKHFYVTKVSSGGAVLVLVGDYHEGATGDPTTSGTLTRISGSGDATITFSAVVSDAASLATATGGDPYEFFRSSDTTPPVFASASVDGNGTTLHVLLTETGSPPILPASGITGFSISDSNGAMISGTGARNGTTNTQIDFSLSGTVLTPDTITVSYSSGTGNVTDSASPANAMASFSGQAVTNNSTQTAVATSYTLSGPASGNINVASSNFTVAPQSGHHWPGSTTITPASTGAGTFSPTSLSPTGTSSATFTYTPTSQSGSPHHISTTNNQSLTNPSYVAYTVTNQITYNLMDATVANGYVMLEGPFVISSGSPGTCWMGLAGCSIRFVGNVTTIDLLIATAGCSVKLAVDVAGVMTPVATATATTSSGTLGWTNAGGTSLFDNTSGSLWSAGTHTFVLTFGSAAVLTEVQSSGGTGIAATLLPPRPVILFQGDSITNGDGVGDDATQNWTTKAAIPLNMQCVQEGNPSMAVVGFAQTQTAISQTWADQSSGAYACVPKLILNLWGRNDVNGGQTLPTFKAAYLLMVQRQAAANPQAVILCEAILFATTNDTNQTSYNSQIQAVVAELNNPLIQYATGMLASYDGSAGLHPDAAHCTLIAAAAVIDVQAAFAAVAGGTSTDPGANYVLGTAYGGVASYQINGQPKYPAATLPDGAHVLTAAWGGPPSSQFGVAGTGSTATATLTIAGNVLAGSGAFGQGGNTITPALTLPAGGNVLYGSGLFGSPSAQVTPLLTLPIANSVLYGSGPFGNPASQFTPNYYPPNTGTVGNLPAQQALVLNTAHFGTGNATAGTATTGSASSVDPGIANVRWGTEYQINGSNLTGICYVPSATNVVFGVNVDATTGTYPSTATTTATVQAADAATLTAKTLNINDTDTSVSFGASAGTAKSKAVYDYAYAQGGGGGGSYGAGYNAAQAADAATLSATTLNYPGNTTILFGASNATAYTAAVYAAGEAAGGGSGQTSGGGNLAMPDGSIAILRGADHRARDGRAWSFADPGVWPSLAGATLTLTLRKIGHNADPAPLVLTGSLAAGPPQIVTFEATAAQTGALLPSVNSGDYVFEVVATLANGDIFPLIPDGLATVVCNVAGSGLPAGQPVPIAPNVAAQW